MDRGFAFVDLSGFTAYTETQGIERATRVLSEFRAAGRQIASDHGVRIAKWLGDGCMVVSVDAPALIDAVLEAEARMAERQLPLGLRVGVTRGEVLLFEGDDHIGPAVNLAARLCDLAGPGEILSDASVLDFLPEGAHAESRGCLGVRGLSQPVRVWRLTSERYAAAWLE